MDENKLKLILYSLFVLHTYKVNEEPSKTELNSLMINSIGTIDNRISDKKSLIQQINDLLKVNIQNQKIPNNEIVEFKIGDIIKTGFSTSIIHLKFIFSNQNEKTLIDVFENDELKLTFEI